MNNPYTDFPNNIFANSMHVATLSGLGDLIESHRSELLSDWQREVAVFPARNI